MEYRVKIRSQSPIIMHNGTAGLDTRSPEKQELMRLNSKKARDRTIEDAERMAQLECRLALWLDERTGKPTIPPDAIRTCTEQAAKRLKQGALVREGFLVLGTAFSYDEAKCGSTVEEISDKAQFTKMVVVRGNRVPRTRAKFDEWECEFTVEVDPEQVTAPLLHGWYTLAGRRIGLGDWRPSKSGWYGRFELVEIARVA